jgi:signal transduction histidine kinase
MDRKQKLPEIQADPEQLKEVLVNLIENACQAMEGGSIVIHESMDSSPGGGRSAVIRLSDDGPGVPESIGEKIFQPFFSTKEEGTGLGLSIAARIVDEHGGTLDFTSREGTGTTFTIILPIKETEN